MSYHRPVAITTAVLALTGLVAPTAFAASAPKAHTNCTALNRVYPHGVAKSSSSRDRTTGEPVTTFTVSLTIYRLNDGAPNKDLDRDDDGVACEKR